MVGHGDDGRTLGEWGIVYDNAFDGASGGHCSERSDTYHVEGVYFCLLRLEAWLCISSVLWETKMSSIQQVVLYYLHHIWGVKLLGCDLAHSTLPIHFPNHASSMEAE